MNTYYVYVITNSSNTLYIGVTNNIKRRIFEHTHKLVEGFTNKYNISKLIYLEECNNITDAIAREKQLKGWTRQKKLNLIRTVNPTFQEIILD